MLVPGPAQKVTIHLNKDTTSAHDYLSQEILALLLDSGVAGATVLHAVAGFGSHRRVHRRSSGIDVDQHMPVQIEFIDSRENVGALLPRLEALLTDGLIEAHDTTILKVVAAPEAAGDEGDDTLR
jgi:PII-like signaling protein